MKALAREPTMAHATDTVTLPAVAAGGVVARSSLLDTVWMFEAATPPNDTAEHPKKYEPVIVTTVPPAVVPDAGLTPLTTGVMPATADAAENMSAVVPTSAVCREVRRGLMGGSGSGGLGSRLMRQQRVARS